MLAQPRRKKLRLIYWTWDLLAFAGNILPSIFVLIVGLIFLTIAYLRLPNAILAKIFSGVAVLFFTAVVSNKLLRYLSGKDFVADEPLMSREALRTYIKSEMATLKPSIATTLDSSDPVLLAKYMDHIRALVTKDVTASVKAELSPEALNRYQLQDIRYTFNASYGRLVLALEELNRRGNLNLVIGVITTILAAIILAYMALSAPTSIEIPQILGHYIPRLSTIIFIEVFAFFFLKLYKTALVDGKFYQLELLSLAKADIALQAAMKSHDVAALASVLSQMTKSDTSSVPVISRDFESKELASILEKLGKLAVEIGKAKTT